MRVKVTYDEQGYNAIVYDNGYKRVMDKVEKVIVEMEAGKPPTVLITERHQRPIKVTDVQLDIQYRR